MKKAAEPKFVYSAGAQEKGEIRGEGHHCHMEGCPGTRLSVRWPDGKTTKPCTKGMRIRSDGQYQII